MAISSGRAADSSTSVMPGRCNRSSRTRSATSRRVCSSWSPCTRTVSTWLRISTRLTTGRSASSGNDRMLSTAFLTSCSALPVSVPLSNSTVTTPRLSVATAVTSFTPSSPRTWSSMDRMTPCSTSAGLAPRCRTDTVIVSALNSGKISCLTRVLTTSPPARNSSMSRLAATRLPAIQAIGPARGPRGLGPDVPSEGGA